MNFAISGIYPSVDGRDFLIAGPGTYGRNMAIIHGDQAIWTYGEKEVKPGESGQLVTYISNLWGDRVSITEPLPPCLGRDLYGEVEDGKGTYYSAGVPAYVKIVNENENKQYIELTVTWAGPSAFSSMVVTNTFGLPEVSSSGSFACMSQCFFTKVPGKDNQYTRRLLAQVVGGYTPQFIQTTATDGVTQKTIFEWSNSYGGGLADELPLKSITHINGVKETFVYDDVGQHDLSNACFDPETGSWIGLTFYGGFSPNPRICNSMDLPTGVVAAVSQIEITGGPAGVKPLNQSIRIAPNWPVVTGDPLSATFLQPEHTTLVLRYPSTKPDGTTPFRGYRLIHPSGGSWKSNTDRQAFLFGTSAILGVEIVHGKGLPIAIVNNAVRKIGLGDTVTGWKSPSSMVVDQLIAYSGWNLHSWAYPGEGLSVTAIAKPDLKVVYTPNLPTRTVFSRLYDDYGPTSTASGTDTCLSMPTLSASQPAIWSNSINPTDPAVRATKTLTRHWDSNLGLLVTDSENSNLYGSALPSMRGGATSVNFGTTRYVYDSLGRLVLTTHTRGDFVTKETRKYGGTNPQPNSVTMSLMSGPIQVLASNDLGAFVGTEFTYDDTPFQWLKTTRNIADGRVETITQRNDRGQIEKWTDKNGVFYENKYDEWGRVEVVTRETLPSLVTTTTYNDCGMPEKVTVQADGKDLVTTTLFDGFGRVVKVTNPDGTWQTTSYNGFGEKESQSPILAKGMNDYGDYSWQYDGKGRLVLETDPQQRTLLSMPKDPECQGLLVSTESTDDRHFTRTVKTDLLGQKRVLLDQKGQETDYFYDQDGHLIRTEQGGQVRRYAYNAMGWLLSRTEPEEGTTVYSEHNLLGEPMLATRTGRLGASQETRRVYLDAHLRPIRIEDRAAGTLSLQRDITYDDTFFVPRSIRETQPYGVITETYDAPDALGRILGKTVSDGTYSFKVVQSLDALGNLTALAYPGGGTKGVQTLSVGFDGVARPTSVSLDGVQKGTFDYGEASVSGSTFKTVLGYGGGTAVSTTTTFTKAELAQVDHAYSNGRSSLPVTWTAGGLMLSRGSDRFEYDALQRLTYAKTIGVAGTIEQTFQYDQWGNRTQNRFSGTKADETVCWDAVYDATNSLPGQVMLVDPVTKQQQYAISTGAIYDDMGRISQANAVPGNPQSLVQWGYDASGRVVKENDASFLLDAGGLRFKRIKADGSISYTIYGFNGEPLEVFEVPVSTRGLSASKVVVTSTQAAAMGITPPVKPPTDPPSVTPTPFIFNPSSNIQVWVGEQVTFTGYDDSGAASTLVWTFGDGLSNTATGSNATHTYAKTGTFTVVLGAYANNTCITASVVVTVVARPVLSLTSSKTSLVLKDTATLSWSVTGGLSTDTVTLVPKGTVAKSGQWVVQPTATTTYTLTVANSYGSSSSSITLAVNAPTAPVITTFSSSASNIKVGQSTTLNFAVSGNANWPFILTLTQVTQDSPTVIQPVTLTGTSCSVTPSETTTYRLTATISTGATSSAECTVVVLQKPVIQAFWATPSAVAAGQGCQLKWGVSNYSSLTLSGVGTVSGTGVTVAMATQTTYTLTATNPAGSVSAQVVVTMANASSSTLVWDRTMVYGFGHLLSEESPSGTSTKFAK
jgi:YD repeat-containing protein